MNDDEKGLGAVELLSEMNIAGALVEIGDVERTEFIDERNALADNPRRYERPAWFE